MYLMLTQDPAEYRIFDPYKKKSYLNWSSCLAIFFLLVDKSFIPFQPF